MPNDSTRIRIRQRPSLRLHEQRGAETEDYINANNLEYPLPGADSHLIKFIAAQGPMATTIHDFWTMVWEQEVAVILMLTELRDPVGREACAQYWPESMAKPTHYGEFRVSVSQIDHFGDFTISTLTLTDTLDANAPERLVYHVQFFPWPDFGVPSNTESVLKLHQCIRGLQRTTGDHRPLLVHCTAGLGRTGVYILIDIMLRVITFNLTPNAEAILSVLREQRCGLVQTEEQFAFALSVGLAQLTLDATTPNFAASE